MGVFKKICVVVWMVLMLPFVKSEASDNDKKDENIPEAIIAAGINPSVYNYAIKGFNSIRDSLHQKFRYLAVVDFSKPSTERRFYLIDLTDTSVVCTDYVCHGKYTGENFATSFSNEIESNKSSLGFFILSESYTGQHGLSIRMDGLDKGFNDNARKRAIVMHTADYADEKLCKTQGRLGRSLGCPALPAYTFASIAAEITNNALIFHYYPDVNYLNNSVWLH
ncbi:murein L,D-transpeptidase catalytic domain family protein [Cytophaga aurantiaca]|uniref:murein L,D-transpeptidase catalytic domain family protein n=1 Tax=Cytophaga aurantiaca TaxID=29530 RepID=UPI000382CEEB|nr:murein L,D-transpeptidase catalytic domain family protein [Cytophaga aurantiaca]